MSPKDLQLKCDVLIRKMLEKHKNESFILCYSGMSGIASATILGLELQKLNLLEAMVYIRKIGERSHGCEVEVASFLTKKNKCSIFFIDDFMDKGRTYEHVKHMCYTNIDNIINSLNPNKSERFLEDLRSHFDYHHLYIALVKKMELKDPC